MPTVPLDDAARIAGFEPAARNPDPARVAEQRETQQQVLDAIQSLPENQRTATTLFYINGYSQDDLAEFLEVPVTTVKKRLHDSRRKLKERMLNMVERTLKNNAAGETFPQKVIRELLERPRPLEIPNHPVRLIADAVRAAFPDYEQVTGDEIVRRSALAVPLATPDDAFHMDEDRLLRIHTTETVMRAMVGRKPPLRLMDAGRVFRPVKREDATHHKVFHQLDLLHIEVGLGVEDMKRTVRRVLDAVFASVEAGLRPIDWISHDFISFEQGFEASITLKGKGPIEVVGCAMLSAEGLRKGGYDPKEVGGYGIGMGLDRMAMMKYDIDSIDKLWQPPYVPKPARGR
jgi:phenylalanyl-tRNA synthetase alpha subunit